MNLILIILVWAIMGAILVTGVVLAVKGIFWLLALGFICFIAAVIRIGILSH
ncbi:MAG TPA: hypothetical protein VFC44_15405 [Candidatus Saccharimonadales bacterium]|jgi:hypothetical protein|nr:hypothetical protein [Candidatus Saccharimonadales bacterium]